MTGARREEGSAAPVSARTLYDYYLIEMQQSDRGWRILRIAHCLSDAKSFTPACIYHRDREAAEEGGRALIDARLSMTRRFKKPRQRVFVLEREHSRPRAGS